MKFTYNDNTYEFDPKEVVAKGMASLYHDYTVGDVFKHENNSHCRVLLIRALYSSPKSYQLVGLGAAVNSGAFFEELHTIEEVAKYIKDKCLVFEKNINNRLVNLVINI